MSELVVGILGFACIVALVVTLFKSKTMPSMAFIIFPSILALILVAGGYYSIEQIGDLIKGGFKSTGPTAALFVFSVLFFGIMTDAGMFDVIINKLMKHVGDNVIGVTVMTALIALMAQVGCFVPAQSANIGLSDRIFTRVGASDDLASGQSTFMVEMTEVANILRNATSKSLLILDEIGRGTSTFDGLSIAWAVVEYISDSKLLGAKTLFATHYHELTELEGKIENVNNYCIAVKEKGDDIVFLRKIVKGGADKSYGIQVAKLAGVPDLVINRAKEIVEELSDEDITSRVSEIAAREHTAKKKGRSKKYDEVDIAQMSLFDTVKDDDVLNELKEIDVTNLTPIDALNTLYRLQNKLKNRW